MKRTVRAAGVAAAAVGLVVSAFLGGPTQAWQGDVAPVTSHYLDHAEAGLDLSAAGLNDVEASGPFDAATAARFAEQVVKLAEAAIPRPRALAELVPAYARAETESKEQDCLASAIYFEARGESVEGQLAVADVVLNRVASTRYPDTICEVVEQPWQFSFVNRTGRIPPANRASQAWRRSVAVARIAEAGAARIVPGDVLWYHADYVAPVWGKRLRRQAIIGLHIFYS